MSETRAPEAGDAGVGDGDSPLIRLTASEAAARIASGEISSEELVSACLTRIEAREETVGAWAHLDPDHALEQARAADRARAAGHGIGPLHGVPVAIKDIFVTAAAPTENGTILHAGRQPEHDASLVEQLRSAGAVILGKTVTTELAVFHPGKTRNPHNLDHTPGGSSSGSAAAVADGHVPVAIGSQTAGSIIRPAAFCGVFGFKPTFGLVSRQGVLPQSAPLDTLGPMARSIEDLALVTHCMAAHDPRDAASWPRSRPPLPQIAESAPPVVPQLAFIGSPAWEEEAEPVTKEAFGELVEHLGDHCDATELPGLFAEGLAWQRTLQLADIAKNYGPLQEKAPNKISAKLTEMIEEGRMVTAVAYNRAREMQDVLYAGLAQVFERYDAIVTPAAPGPAPSGLDSTGSPAFNALWTYMGVPAVTLPLLEADGLPMGVQLVGPRRDDARLLRTARWLLRFVTGEGEAA